MTTCSIEKKRLSMRKLWGFTLVRDCKEYIYEDLYT